MNTVRHFHYIDSPSAPARVVLELDRGKLNHPFGTIDLIYGGRIPNPDFVSNTLEDVGVLVQDDLLVLSEVLEAGDVVTVELRSNHVLEDIILDKGHELVELVNDAGMLYWIQAGRSGVVSIKARVVQDKKDASSKIAKIRANMKDHVYRDYLAKQARAGTDVPRREWPKLMTFAEAAEFTGLSVHTLRHESPKDLPRVKRKLRKQDLESYLEKRRR